MRGTHGYATLVDPDRPTQEWDVVSCVHCGKQIFVKPGTASTVYLIPTRTPGLFLEEPGASCFCCMRPVCLPCYDLGTCTPLERRLAQMEGRRG